MYLLRRSPSGAGLVETEDLFLRATGDSGDMESITGSFFLVQWSQVRLRKKVFVAIEGLGNLGIGG